MKVFTTTLTVTLSVLAATCVAAPALPDLPAGLPGLPGLPAGLPSLPGLPAGLPGLPTGGAGGAGDLVQTLTKTVGGLTRGATDLKSAPLLRKRSSHLDAVLDALVQANTKVFVKALLKLKVDLCSDIRAKVNVISSGLITSDADVLIPKISAKVKAAADAAIQAKIDLDANVFVLDRIHEHSRNAVHKYCPHADDRCILKHAKHIVGTVEVQVKLDVQRLFIALKANLMAHVRAKLDVVVRELGVNLLLEQIHVKAFVEAVATLNVHLDLCAHVIVKGLHVTVLANVLDTIKSILAGL